MSPDTDKIIDLAVYIFDGEKVIDEFITLVHPERFIPGNITSLTGITNDMVAQAPPFYLVAKRFLEITKDCTFVAHNVSFDYKFIKAEFESLGFPYHSETLCTLKLARKLIKGLPSYKLGVLCKHFSIKLDNAHRAFADAYATTQLLNRLLKVKQKEKSKEMSIEDMALALPERCGVYYFMDKNDTPIYIGKSIHIRSRVLEHLQNKSASKDQQIRARTKKITYTETGSELIALLHESHEIKKYQPKYNRSQKTEKLPWGIYKYHNEQGYTCFAVKKCADETASPLLTFKNKRNADNFLIRKTEELKLCQTLNGLHHPNGASCFLHQLNLCYGACQQQEEVEVYNRRTGSFIESLHFHEPDFAIVDKGRKPQEKSIVLIANGLYVGWSFVDEQELSSSKLNLHQLVNKYEDHDDIRKIVKRFVEDNTNLQLISLS